MNQANKVTDPRTSFYADCENEPVHIPGMIQSAGAMVVVNHTDWHITSVSANVEDILGQLPESLLDTPVSDLIGEKVFALLEKENLVPKRDMAVRVFTLDLNKQDSPEIDVVMMAHRIGEWVVLEFEQSIHNVVPSHESEYKLMNFNVDLQEAENEPELIQRTINLIQQVTGFDHVMFYKFDEDGAGTVLNESRKNDEIASFLEHRFPASDIPQIVRDIYRKNPSRVIFDAEAVPVAMLSKKSDVDSPPLDMTYSCFRAVSPVHIEYLQNMDVRSSFSMAVIIDDVLIGIIACLNRDALHLNLTQRATSQNLLLLFKSYYTHRYELDRYAIEHETRHLFSDFSQEIADGGDYITAISKYMEEILSLFDANALFLNYEGKNIFYPDHITDYGIPDITASDLKSDIYISETLARDINLNPGLMEYFTGGVLINLDSGDYMLVGRKEQLKTLSWAGDPSSKIQTGDKDTNLSPRHSFESWVEEVRGRSRPFVDSDIRSAEILRQVLIRADALEHRRQLEMRLQQEAITDHLTGLLNRRGFSKRSNEEIERSKRYGHALSIIYFDIDHFKKINDTYGHDFGDTVLVALTDYCKSSFRINDIVGRMGGEEFAVLLPQTKTANAAAVADDLRVAINELKIPHEEDSISVTISCGVATYDPDKVNDLDKLIDLADKRLYKAKNAGRNQVNSGQ